MYRNILSSNAILRSLSILIVDDSEIGVKIIQKFLHEAGFENVFFAVNGVDALRKIEELHPSIIVTDIYMPEMDGFELCKHIKANDETKDLPIIIQTSATDTAEISKAFDVGVNDVVIKPIQKDEFLSRLVLHLENSLFRRRIKQELQSAIELQASIMPDQENLKAVSAHYSVDIASLFHPCSEVGGDFWGFKEVSLSELSIYNVDISGHGVASAMNALRIHTLMQGKMGVLPTPDLFIRKLNRKVCELISAGQYATMFYGIINFEENYIEYTNAASPLPMILRADGKVEILEKTFLPVGVSSASGYESIKVPFKKNDQLIIFSDALVETPNDHGEFLNQYKLAKSLNSYSGKSAQELLNFINSKFEDFIGKNTINDDLTINVYKRL